MRKFIKIFLVITLVSLVFVRCENKPSERKIKLQDIALNDTTRIKDSGVTILKIEPAQRRSIAVMYFKNQTGDTNLDWMQRGIAEMLVTSLSQSRYLDVITLERLYGLLRKLGESIVPSMDVRLATIVGKEAHVESILLGRLRKESGQIVVETQLVETNSGTVIGTEKVSGNLENAFTMIDDLSKKVKSGIRVQYAELPEEEVSLAKVTTSSIRAYEFYNKGQWHSERLENDLAIENYEKAVQADPYFALAYAQLSDEYLMTGDDLKAIKNIEQAVKNLDRAAPIDQEYIRGAKAIYDLDYDLAMEKLNRVISADSNRIDACIRLGGLLIELQQFPKAERIIKLARTKNEFSPLPLILQAQCYLSTGRIAEARHLLDQANQLNPNSAISKVVNGVIFWMAGQPRQAAIEFRNALKMQPNNLSALLNLGFLYSDAEDNDLAAIELFENGLKVSPNSSTILRVLGVFYRNVGRYDDALKVFEKAAKLHNRLKPNALLGSAAIYLRLKNYSKARSYFNEYFVMHPDTVSAHCAIAGLLLEENMLFEAQREAEIALKSRPDLLCALNALSHIRVRQGRFQQAIDLIQKMLEQSPSAVNYRTQLAGHLIDLDQYDKALEIARACITDDPKTASPYYIIWWINSQLGQHRQAIELIQQLHTQLPKFDQGYLWQGESCLNLNQTEAAEKAFDQFLALTSDSVNAERDIATAYLNCELNDKALSYLKELPQKRLETIWAYRSYAQGLLKDWQLDKAIQEFQKALQIFPDDLESLSNLGHAYRLNGDKEEARDIYETFANKNLSATRQCYSLKWIAMTYAETGHYRRALKHLKKAYEFAEKDNNLGQIKETGHSQACLYRETGQYDDAIKIYKKLIAMDDDAEWLRCVLAATYLEKGALKQVRDMIHLIQQRIANGAPKLNQKYVHELLSALFLHEGRADSAIYQAHKAFEIRKNYRDYFYYFLAQGHFIKGDMDSACYYCDKYIHSTGEDFYYVYLRPRTRLLKARALAELGQSEAAITETRTIFEQFEDGDKNVFLRKEAGKQLEELQLRRGTGD